MLSNFELNVDQINPPTIIQIQVSTSPFTKSLDMTGLVFAAYTHSKLRFEDYVGTCRDHTDHLDHLGYNSRELFHQRKKWHIWIVKNTLFGNLVLPKILAKSTYKHVKKIHI